MKKDKGYHSTVGEKGEIITEYVKFSKGGEKTFEGIIVKTIKQGEFTQFDLLDGRRIYLNTKNIDFFEVYEVKK